MRTVALPSLLALLAACHACAHAGDPPAAPAVASGAAPALVPAVAQPVVAAPPAVAPRTPAPPAGTSAACEDHPAKVAGLDDRRQPLEIAACPDVMDMVRGNGIDFSHDPAMTPSVTPNWDLAAMHAFACAYACAGTGATALLLAWYAVEDSRPLRNHYAAYVVEHPATAGRATWTVVVMYRHSWNLWWNILTGPHVRERPVRKFSHRPTVAEVEAVLAENRWTYTGDPDFKLLAGNVIEENWLSALGGPATKFFPAGIEQ
jgi:hypothetical protein